jgi:hypothetical protein
MHLYTQQDHLNDILLNENLGYRLIDTDMLIWLIDWCSGRGARVHITDIGDDTPLHLAYW